MEGFDSALQSCEAATAFDFAFEVERFFALAGAFFFGAAFFALERTDFVAFFAEVLRAVVFFAAALFVVFLFAVVFLAVDFLAVLLARVAFLAVFFTVRLFEAVLRLVVFLTAVFFVLVDRAFFGADLLFLP